MRVLLCLLACSGVFFTSAQAQFLDTIFVATDVPVAIPDGPDGIAQSFMFVGVSRTVLDVNVTVTITHTFDQDLRLYIEAPNDDVVRLSFQCGQSGNDYINTCFDDSATTDICDGNPPFTGCFRPNQPLSEFNNLGSYGTWIFRVTDNAAQDVGTIQAWQIRFVLGDTVSTVEPFAPALPRVLSVEQNYPNPFNATTMLPFELAHEGVVTITVVDGLGRQVKQYDQLWSAGRHTYLIDGSAWSSGSYFATLVAQHQSETVRLLLVK